MKRTVHTFLVILFFIPSCHAQRIRKVDWETVARIARKDSSVRRWWISSAI